MQIHKILQGIPAIRSLVAVGAGAAKLISMPVENYQKDKRLLKGMQRGTLKALLSTIIGLNWLASYEYILLVPGTTAFLRSISLEAVGLGVHLAAGAQDILLQAEYLSTTIAPSVPWPVPSKVKTNVRSNQPKDAQQGLQQVNDSTCYEKWC